MSKENKSDRSRYLIPIGLSLAIVGGGVLLSRQIKKDMAGIDDDPNARNAPSGLTAPPGTLEPNPSGSLQPEATIQPSVSGEYQKGPWTCAPLEEPIIDKETHKVIFQDWPLKKIRDLRGLPQNAPVPAGQGPYGLDRNGTVIELPDYGYFSTLRPLPQPGEGVCIKGEIFIDPTPDSEYNGRGNRTIYEAVKYESKQSIARSRETRAIIRSNRNL